MRVEFKELGKTAMDYEAAEAVSTNEVVNKVGELRIGRSPDRRDNKEKLNVRFNVDSKGRYNSRERKYSRDREDSRNRRGSLERDDNTRACYLVRDSRGYYSRNRSEFRKRDEPSIRPRDRINGGR